MTPRRARALVTGPAGFIGSHLCERLVSDGHEVLGVDCFTDFYPRATKEANLVALRDAPSFQLVERDIAVDPLEDLVDGIDVVYHLAAQAGVRGSFGETFAVYAHHNIRGTQRLLEAVAGRDLDKFVYASSSSIYGHAEAETTPESTDPCPISPYGMTKVATEQLAGVYLRTRGVPVVGLRYFTVYGPRQRPDMAFTRFIARALSGEPLTIFGDGSQVRDFTYIDDIVAGTLAAAEHGRPGVAYNIGGGTPTTLRSVLDLLAVLIGRPLELRHEPVGMGEARRTASDTSLARRDLSYRPHHTLESGLSRQIEWLQAAQPVVVDSV